MPQGFGAGDTRPTTVPQTSASDGDDQCPQHAEPASEPLSSQSRGCAVDNWRRDMDDMTMQLHKSMTRGFCVKRCGQNGYRYAGVQYSFECRCSNSFGLYGSGEGCTRECSAKNGLSCGGGWRNEVFATGAVPASAWPSCGPGSRGVVSGGKCYYVGEDRLNFFDAQRACVKMGGNLATVSSATEQADIKAYLGQSKFHIWIGLTDVAKEGAFVFMDGTPATYINGDLGYDNSRIYDDFVGTQWTWVKGTSGEAVDGKMKTVTSVSCQHPPPSLLLRAADLTVTDTDWAATAGATSSSTPKLTTTQQSTSV
ncbi:macrophage mannose receptor 1-like [Haliotis rubra]|uniref:macrophage mannose receptor 1-like n=1 Tax=Haliotis rubra TaxID=36100 RepID=UPI001EE60903|nr:macrophage mannose receptor 1-like [Haliotis rubra]